MDFFWHLLAVIGMSLPSILGYNLIFGKGKLFHLGHVGVAMIAAYTTFLTVEITHSLILGALAGMTGSMLVSLFLTWCSLRLKSDGFGILSLALHMTALAVVCNWDTFTHGSLGVAQIPQMPLVHSPPAFALSSAGISLICIIACFLIHRSPFGRRLSALAEHDWHALSLGVRRPQVHFLGFLLAGIGAAITSFLEPQYIQLLHPSDYSFPKLILLLTIVIAGKPGSVLGVTCSTILLTLLSEGLRFIPLAPSTMGPFRLILFGFILFVVVALRKNSLFPPQRSV